MPNLYRSTATKHILDRTLPQFLMINDAIPRISLFVYVTHPYTFQLYSEPIVSLIQPPIHDGKKLNVPSFSFQTLHYHIKGYLPFLALKEDMQRQIETVLRSIY